MLRVHELARMLDLRSQELLEIIQLDESLSKEAKVSALASLDDGIVDRILKVVQELKPTLDTESIRDRLMQRVRPVVKVENAFDRSLWVGNLFAEGGPPREESPDRSSGNLKDWDLD